MLMDVSAEGARGLQEGKGRAAKEDVFPFGVFPQIQLLSSSQSPHSLSLSLSHAFILSSRLVVQVRKKLVLPLIIHLLILHLHSIHLLRISYIQHTISDTEDAEMN